MRAFTYNDNGCFSPGIELHDQGDLHSLALLLGQGHCITKVWTGKVHPPLVDSRNRVMSVYPATKRRASDGTTFVVLEEPRVSHAAILVHIQTRGVKRWNGAGPRVIGTWEVLEGHPQVVAEGAYAPGLSGRRAEWRDSLVVMHPGDAIKISRANTADMPSVIEHTITGPRHILLSQYEDDSDHLALAFWEGN